MTEARQTGRAAGPVSRARPAANGAGDRATPKRGPGRHGGDRAPDAAPPRSWAADADREVAGLPGSSRRLLRMLRPAPAADRRPALLLGVGQRHPVGARARRCSADATDLIFAGVVGNARHPGRGRPRPRWSRGCGPGGPRHAGRHALGDARRPRPGHRLRRVGQVLLLVLLVYLVRLGVRRACRAGSRRPSCSGRSSGCASRSRRSCPGCR